VKLGVYLYGLATLAAGVFDLIWGEFEPGHQPIQAWGTGISHQQVLAYIAAVWLILAGAAIMWRRTARAGAAACVVIYSVFAVFWLPRFVTAPRVLGFHLAVYIGVMGGVAQQAILIMAAVIVYTLFATRASGTPENVAIIARLTFGLSSLNFGIDHFTGVRLVAALVPSWLPFGGNFWAVLTGIAFLLAGIAILLGILDVLAARLLALMLLVFSVLALAPPVFRDPRSHAAWGANAYNLAAAGAAWIFAEWIAGRNPRQRHGDDEQLLQVS